MNIKAEIQSEIMDLCNYQGINEGKFWLTYGENDYIMNVQHNISEGQKMSKLQELIIKYNKEKSKDTFKEIIHEIQTCDMLYSAFSPITKGHYADFVNGAATAFVFSEKSFCEGFCKHMKAEGLTVGIAECKKESRLSMLADYHRCGFETVLVDNGHYRVQIELNELINIPDFESMPEEERPVINPQLMMSASMFFQCLENKSVTPDKEINLLVDTYRAHFLIPVEGEPKDGRITVPALERNDGLKFVPFFTDSNEAKKYDANKKFKFLPASFEQMKEFTDSGETVVLNPFGFNFNITKDTCEGMIAASKMVPKDNAGRAVIYTIERPNPVLVRKLSEICDENGNVKRAFIKGIRKNGKNSTIIVLDCADLGEDETKEAVASVKERAGELLEEEFEFFSTRHNIGKITADNTEPFFEIITVDVSETEDEGE